AQEKNKLILLNLSDNAGNSTTVKTALPGSLRIERASIVFTPLVDGTSVLLNLDTASHFKLNRTGTAIWQRIEAQGSITIDDLSYHFCNQFNVDQKEATRIVKDFIKHLEELRLIRISSSSSAAIQAPENEPQNINQ
ncbi:MAG: PqqD family protein, partial [Acidobacteriota bacterium]